METSHGRIVRGDESRRRASSKFRRPSERATIRRCWLEVEDPRHRYAKNLRRYHFEWVRLDRPGDDFFAWLAGDSVVARQGGNHDAFEMHPL